MHQHRIYAARAFALSNNLNQVMLDSENPRLGIVTSGKTYLDVMEAHIEGKGCSTLNQTGLAQKFGAVVSHVRVAQHQQQINAVRISEGDADLLLGCDLVVSAMPEAIARLNIERSHSIVNNCQNPTADFIHDKNYTFPTREMQQLIGDETGADKASFAGIPD